MKQLLLLTSLFLIATSCKCPDKLGTSFKPIKVAQVLDSIQVAMKSIQDSLSKSGVTLKTVTVELAVVKTVEAEGELTAFLITPKGGYSQEATTTVTFSLAKDPSKTMFLGEIKAGKLAAITKDALISYRSIRKNHVLDLQKAGFVVEVEFNLVWKVGGGFEFSISPVKGKVGATYSKRTSHKIKLEFI